MIITRRFFVTECPIGRGLTIDVRTSPKISINQAQSNAESLAKRKLKIKSVSSTPIDIFSDVKPDYSIGPKINLRTFTANNINLGVPAKISPTQKKALAYLDGRGAACPHCGGNIEGGSMSFDSGEICQKITCTNCNEQWNDIYKLTAVTTTDGELIASVGIQAEKRA